MSERRGSDLRLIDRFIQYADLISKKAVARIDDLALAMRPIWSVDRKATEIFFGVFAFLVAPPTGRSGFLKSLFKVIVAIPLALFSIFSMFIVTLVGGTLSGMFGFRNQIEYSFLEQLAAWTFLLLFLICLPWIVSKYILYTVTMILISAIILCGLDILFGHCGILSLGHAAFVLLGAYFTTWFYLGTFGFTLPFIVAVPLAALVVSLMGLVLGIPALKIKDQHLVVLTMAFCVTVPKILKSQYVAPYSGLKTGGLAISQPGHPEILKWIGAEAFNYFFVLVAFLLLITFAYNLIHHSQIGRALKTIKCDVEISGVLGVPVLRYKLMAFWLSAFYAAVGGGLLMLPNRFIGMESHGIQESTRYQIALIIGGSGSILGTAFGATYFVYEQNVSEWFAKIVPNGQSLMLVISGTILILIIYIAPYGLAGSLVRYLKAKFAKPVRRGEYHMAPPPDYDYLESKNFPVEPRSRAEGGP